MSHVSEPKAHPATIDEIITTVIMARVTDFFGFFVYAIASALVFPKLFFPMYSPVTGTLISFAIFSLAFLARPFASILGRQVERRIGRVGKVALALLILGTSTVAIGLLPGFEKIGWVAPVLLAAFRIGQGIGLGGAWDGLTLQLQYTAPKRQQGWYAMVPQLGGPIGFVVAAAMFFVLTGFLTDEEFIKWGWRFAFFAVFAVNVVSLFARIRLLNSDFGADQEGVTSAPLDELLRKQWQPVLICSFIPLASYALFHLVTVFPLGYAMVYSNASISRILVIQLIGGALAIGSVIASGYLSDRYGRRQLLTVTSILIGVLSLMIISLNGMEELFILLGFILLGLSYGQAGVVSPERFEKRFRYSGTALSTNLSWITGAAFAPLVALSLTAMFGLWAASLYLLSGVAITLVTLQYLREEEE